MRRVVVVGCGVIGLSTGIRLLEAGYEVVIRARERTPRTTSDVAGAVFYPFDAMPRERVAGWARASYGAFRRLADDPATGVAMRELVDLQAAPAPDPWWRSVPEGFRHARADELPLGFAGGFVARVPVVDMPRYLWWLETRFQTLGGRIEEGEILALGDLEGAAEVVVNCSGLGARELADDPLVRPVRGQVARVRNPGLSRALLDETSSRAIAYVIPRGEDVVLGGTSEEGGTSRGPDPLVEEAILAKCADLEPRLRGCEVLSRGVGLRPKRPEVRLEAERVGGLPVVHNYGHGGVGVSLSWGCAEEAAALVRASGPPERP